MVDCRVSMAKKTEGTFVNSRKQELYTVCWLPSTPPHAVVYWHHGLCEYVDRYDYGGCKLLKLQLV